MTVPPVDSGLLTKMLTAPPDGLNKTHAINDIGMSELILASGSETFVKNAETINQKILLFL